MGNVCSRVFPFLMIATMPSWSVCDVVLIPERGAVGGPMEGTDKFGNALSCYRIGEINAKRRKIGVYAYWRSMKDVRSSLWGVGWEIPFLESRIVPLDENRFECVLPDGFRVTLFKAAKKKDRLVSKYNFCGEEKGSLIRLFVGTNISPHADFVFKNGRLSDMLCFGSKFKYEYIGKSCSRIVCDGKDVCRIDSKNGAAGLARIDFIGGMGVSFKKSVTNICVEELSGLAQLRKVETLSALKISDGRQYEFAYGMDKSGHGIFSDGIVRMLWNPSDGTIVQLNDWRYSITRGDSEVEGVRFYRKHKEGVVEEHHRNYLTGIMVREANGVRDTSRVFTSGSLKGKVRWNEKSGLRYDERTEYSYDELGRLRYFKVLYRKENKVTETWMNELGMIAKFRVDRDDKQTSEYIYADDGKCAAVVQNGKIIGHQVANAEEFAKWHKDMKKGVKRPAPKIKPFGVAPVIDAKTGRFVK